MTLLLQSPSFELRWQPQQGAIRLQSPGRSLLGVVGVEFARQGRSMTLSTEKMTPGRIAQDTVQDAQGQAEQVHLHYQELQGLALGLRIRLYNTRPFILFQLSVTNVGPDPVRMRRFFMTTGPEGLQPH